MVRVGCAQRRPEETTLMHVCVYIYMNMSLDIDIYIYVYIHTHIASYCFCCESLGITTS